MEMDDIRVIVMCKAPVPGAVKTRLMSRYSAAQAAQWHATMATTVIERAKRLFNDVVIAADDPKHDFFTGFGLPVTIQAEGDLGDRMNRQIGLAFADAASAVLLLGTDSPHMPESRLVAATHALEHADVVLGPVEDGGYDLVAMNRPLSVFSGVVWSSDQVLHKTLENILHQGLTVEQLGIGFDVDFPDDIEKARQAGWISPGLHSV
ncbi:MAG: TIGR04282 family arsenosugar biosynthesis glycosyltransferase [Mariprofundus sp.]|nr:TIGR04282 family arsenosugar biosynthesis glycosyltransferase [Mariprofundus sp.]